MKYIIVLIFSYLLGSIPFGLLMGKWWAKVDVRQYGSGNIGMTNVLRTAGYVPALITLLGDVGKGYAAVFLATGVTDSVFLALLAGVAAVVGHNWPVFLRFRGGKGVATAAGVVLAVRPWSALVLFLIWLGVLVRFRYISLASIVVAICLPFVLLLFGVSLWEFALALVLGIFTVLRHRSNIERLRSGTEFRFGEKIE
ncbi:MAG TPA: glycerol-3-phosphate 1-O-acyltransferase PlsY [Firmicutes bacterium]|nr:glycerol-3-phosphate 1-O-acyltransferase PlsY [Bacillota bacterium]